MFESSPILTEAIGGEVANWVCFNPYLNFHTNIVFNDLGMFVVQPRIEEYAINKCLYWKLSPDARKIAEAVCYNSNAMLAHGKTPNGKAKNQEYRDQQLSQNKIRYYFVETHGWTHQRCYYAFEELKTFVGVIAKEE